MGRETLRAHDFPSCFAATPASSLEMNALENQAVLRSSHDFTHHVSLDAQLRFADKVQFISSHLAADVHLSWRPKANLELSICGRNLLDSHPEQAGTIGVPTAEVPRRFYGKVTWHF